MWEFLDRLVSVAIPRIRDFRGLPATAWDGRGNYTFGVNEQVIFPEIDYDRVDQVRGMDITIVTTATTNDAGKALLDAYGFPFKRGVDEAAADEPRPARSGPGQRPWRPAGEEEVTGTEDARNGQEGTDQQAAGASRSSRCAATRVAAAAVGRAPSTGSSACAASACASSPTPVRSPA